MDDERACFERVEMVIETVKAMPRGERLTKPIGFFEGSTPLGIGTQTLIALEIRKEGLSCSWENRGYGPQLCVWAEEPH